MKKLRVFGVPQHFEFTKLYYIINIWQRFIREIVIIVESLIRDMASIIVHKVAGCKLMEPSIRNWRLSPGERVFIKNVFIVEKNFMFIPLKKILGSFVHKLVQIKQMLRSNLRQEWAMAIQCMEKDLGIILMGKESITMQKENGEDLLQKLGTVINVKFAIQ
jgi:hypothetical protein